MTVAAAAVGAVLANLGKPDWGESHGILAARDWSSLRAVFSTSMP